MGGNTVIKIENLSKRYVIGAKKKTLPYRSLRDDIVNVTMGLIANPGKFLLPSKEEKDFWALKDINHEIERGDKVAIIGQNGAGKSTLLKILSRITKPTEGRITIKGRISSLLEVGTGFHPELTGRENIYLNGSILGMTHAEVKRKFDEIVEFSGVEKFLDTPVKRYSSGMRMRLGFAVAANLESEVLIIDEVLAVGDASFQKKCMGKMDEVSRSEGRTILFVSHNMGAVQQLCDKGLVFDKGQLILSGTINQAVQAYFEHNSMDKSHSVWERKDEDGSYFNRYMDLNSVKLVDKMGRPVVAPLFCGEPPTILLGLKRYVDDAEIGYILYNNLGHPLYVSSTIDLGENKNPVNNILNENIVVSTSIPPHLLNEGVYYVAPFGFRRNDACFFHPGRNQEIPRLRFQLAGGLSQSEYFTRAREGELAPLLSWNKYLG